MSFHFIVFICTILPVFRAEPHALHSLGTSAPRSTTGKAQELVCLLLRWPPQAKPGPELDPASSSPSPTEHPLPQINSWRRLHLTRRGLEAKRGGEKPFLPSHGGLCGWTPVPRARPWNWCQRKRV